MGRATRHTALETRTARLRLKPRKAPHWVAIGKGLRLGYYRLMGSGTWIVRWYVGGHNYQQQAIGLTDDHRDSNGSDVFDYFSAQARARELTETRLKNEGGVPGKPYMV